MIDRLYACSCVCILGSISGLISIPLIITGIIELPTKLSDTEMRTLNIQEQRNLLTQRVFDSEGWKYCISGFTFMGVGIVAIGSILLYLCLVRPMQSISPEPMLVITHVLSATSPPLMHSPSTTDALPPTSAANVPAILLESPL